MIENQNNLERYKLSEEVHNHIFETIRKSVFAQLTSVENPTAVIVGAPSGSGKGTVMGYSKRLFPDDNVAIITTDEYKPFHPEVETIATNCPDQFIHIIEQESGSWTNKILAEAIQHKYNFIFECTLKNERILERIKELKEKEFRIIVRGLSVSYLEAILTVYERYELQLRIRNWGRLVTIKSFQEAYENIPYVIEKIEKSGLCDVVEVYKRGTLQAPIRIYTTEESGEYQSAKQAIMTQREQYEITKEEAIARLKKLDQNLTKIEKEKIQDQYEKLSEMIENYRG